VGFKLRKLRLFCLTFMILLSFVVVPSSKVENVAASKKMWLGYDLTTYLEYNSTSVGFHGIALRGANGSVVGMWNCKLYGFSVTDPTPSAHQQNQSLTILAAFGGFADVLTRANFIRNALVGYGEVDANTPCPYGGFVPHQVSYVGYIHAYQKVYVLTVLMNRTLANPPNNSPLNFWATVGHNVNVTWDETRNAYVIEGVNGFPHMVFGTLSNFMHRHMREFLSGNGFWSNEGRSNWGANDTITSLQSNSTSYIDCGLQFNSTLANLYDTKNVTIIIAVGDSKAEALANYDVAVAKGAATLLSETVGYWRSWLNQGPSFLSSDYPWIGEWVNHTLLNIMGMTWQPRANYTVMTASFGIYRSYCPWWDALYPCQGLIRAGHYQDAYDVLSTYLNSSWCSWGSPTSPNDYAWGYGFVACETYLLWQFSGNDTLIRPLYENLVQGWGNITIDKTHGWDSAHQIFKNRGGLDHPWRYYRGWGGDGGYYCEVNLLIMFGLESLAEIATHFGQTSTAQSLQGYADQIRNTVNNDFWNSTEKYYNFSRWYNDWDLLKGYTLYETEAAAWGQPTARLYLHTINYLDDWYKGRNIKFPYQWEQDSGGSEQNAIRAQLLGSIPDAFLKLQLYNDWRSIIENYWSITPRPFVGAGESVNVNASLSASSGTAFVWSQYIGLNALTMAERHSDNRIYLRPAIDFTIRWPDGTTLSVIRHGDDAAPLTEYAINGSKVQVTSWTREVSFTVSPGNTYEVDVYFGSRPALTCNTQQLKFFNRTEVWDSAEKTLNLTFLEGLPTANKTIVVYCSKAPSKIEGGVLLSYANNLAAISLAECSVSITFAPDQPPTYYVWGAIAAAGGGFAYWLYRMKRRKTS